MKTAKMKAHRGHAPINQGYRIKECKPKVESYMITVLYDYYRMTVERLKGFDRIRHCLSFNSAKYIN
jgi:hypothetical protein